MIYLTEPKRHTHSHLFYLAKVLVVPNMSILHIVPIFFAVNVLCALKCKKIQFVVRDYYVQ